MDNAAKSPALAWPVVVLAGAVLPAAAMLWLKDLPAPAPLALVGGPIFAVGLMGIGMIGTASAGRLRIGLPLVLLAGVGLILLARLLGMPSLPHPVSTGLAVIAASISFAARGSLFARALPGKGWLIALFVVAGEAAILVTAAVMPGALPAWLLALLPAQWASTAIQTALTGTGTRAASSALFALAGTAATTLLVAWLWPRRWPYLLMFSAWLALSALVWHRPGPPPPAADMAVVPLSPLPPDTGTIAPIASTPPDAALASALARVERQLDKWQPASGTDPAQRTRNLLLIAAVADVYDTSPLQAHLPLLVEAQLKKRLPPDRLPALLADIAAYPDRGSVLARETLPVLGLPASTGDDAAVRNRMAIYAAKLAARL